MSCNAEGDVIAAGQQCFWRSEVCTTGQQANKISVFELDTANNIIPRGSQEDFHLSALVIPQWAVASFFGGNGNSFHVQAQNLNAATALRVTSASLRQRRTNSRKVYCLDHPDGGRGTALSMPRRTRRRSSRRPSRHAPVAVHARAVRAVRAAMAPTPPGSVVDSDAASASLSSSVCDDYYKNLVEEGLHCALAAAPDVEPLDLAAGLELAPSSPGMEEHRRSASALREETAVPDAERVGALRLSEEGQVGRLAKDGKGGIDVFWEHAGKSFGVPAHGNTVLTDSSAQAGSARGEAGDICVSAGRWAAAEESPLAKEASPVHRILPREHSAITEGSAEVREANEISADPMPGGFESTDVSRHKDEDSHLTAPRLPHLTSSELDTVALKSHTKDPLPLDVDFVPGVHTSRPIELDSADAKEASRQEPSAAAIREEGELIEDNVLNPILDELNSFDRQGWELVESQAMAAFRFFKKNPVRGSNFPCVPMTQSKVRLAMHRAAEVLGASSTSHGAGRNRFVMLTWKKNGSFAISEPAMLEAVRSVLGEVFEPGWQSKKTKREAKKALKREKKLAAEAEFLDACVDPELLEELVARKDWYALEKLFQGVPIPGLPKMKRKQKQERKREREEAWRGPQGASNSQRTGHSSSQPASSWDGRRRANASVTAPPLQDSNKGYAMLQKMGWREGQGLGATEEGRTQPVRPEFLHGRAGLGQQK